MSKIAILTDSSCDIPQELAEKYGIDIMGFHILLDDEDIVEREKYTPEEFYDKMRAAKGIPSTAAITPIQFCEKYCQYVDEGYTDVIHVPINRSGSSTYNNAVMAQGMLREERPEHHLNIHLLDPHTYSMVFGWYVCEMARKLQNGAELRHVIGEFEAQMNKMEVILGPYSLKQMKKSGRISAAAAVMGELMGIRPIITLIDGKTRVESDYIFQTDSDGQTDPNEFKQFWNLRNEYDAIIGSRSAREDGVSRKFVEKTLLFILKITFGVRIPDSNAPFRLMKRQLIEKYIDKMPTDFNLPNVMFTTYFSYFHEKIKFIEISFKPRQGGVNSINIKKIVKIGWKALGDFKYLKKHIDD